MSQETVENVESGKIDKVPNGKFKKSIYLLLFTVFSERFCSGGIFGKNFARLFY